MDPKKQNYLVKTPVGSFLVVVDAIGTHRITGRFHIFAYSCEHGDLGTYCREIGQKSQCVTHCHYFPADRSSYSRCCSARGNACTFRGIFYVDEL